MPLFRRRPLMRAAMVGGGAYMAGKHVAHKQEAEAEPYTPPSAAQQRYPSGPQTFSPSGPQPQYPSGPQPQYPSGPQQQYGQPRYPTAPQQYAPPAAPAAAPAAPAESREDAIAQLKDLKGLLDSGVLTQAEFDAQKTKILGEMS